jgi:hypothetical protein
MHTYSTLPFEHARYHDASQSIRVMCYMSVFMGIVN